MPRESKEECAEPEPPSRRWTGARDWHYRPPVIRAEGLTRRFGDYLAVDSLDLDIAEGEVFGLLGPNGAGKTTTVRMLTGVIAPSSGRATVAGASIVDEPATVRARVGILTETPGIYVRLDAVENLEFFAELYDVRDPAPRIRTWLERLGLWARRHEPVGSYSKGMRQKLAIARSLLHDPKVLFLDEPTSALDPESARTVREIIAELRGEGRTIVLCTHNLDEAQRLCHRIGVLKTRLVRVDRPDSLRRALYGRASHVRVAGDVELAMRTIRAVDGVGAVEPENGTLRVTLSDPEHANPAIVRALVSAGVDVISITEEARSLEEVYLRLLDEHASSGGAS